MSKPIHLVAYLPIKENEVQKVKDLLQPLIKYVWENEPGCSRYNMHVTNDGMDILFIETYDSEKDLQKHRDGPEYKKFFETVEKDELFRSDPQLFQVNDEAGFESRTTGLQGMKEK